MNHLALDIVSRALFDASTEEDAERIGHELEIVLLMLNKLVMPLGGLRLALPLPSSRRYFTALRRLDEVVYGLIRQKRGLLLQDLLSVEMDEQQLRDEVMTLFVAGHDTTANALAWTWYLLAQHPEAQTRLIEEARALSGDPTAEDYARLPFTERVLAESMRLFPPVWILGRRALSPYAFGEFTAPAGSVLLVCMQVLHRHPDLWPDPDQFDPDRPPPAHKFSFLPFGAGSRLCIGERFAWMEGVLSIATIARRWRFELVPGHPVEPLGLLTLRPKHGLRMRLSSMRSEGRTGSYADHPAPM
jgi:cytochrome P450